MDYESLIYGLIGGFIVLYVVLLLICYVCCSLGSYMLYKTYGGEYGDKAWMAWVPFANNYMVGKFLQEQNNEEEWMKWVMAFGWALSFIPYIGSLAFLAVEVLVIVEWCKYLSRINAPVYLYVIFFLINIIFYFLLNDYVKKNVIVKPYVNTYGGNY